jgi:outer membrane lipoprotein-sorting protein
VKRAALSVWLLLAALIPAQAWCAEDLDRVLQGLKETYGHLPGFSLDYTREVVTRSMSLLGNQISGDRAKGVIFFKPPHFLKLEQEEPAPETLTTDGTVLWWYLPRKREAHRYDAHKFGKELGLLADIFRGLTNVGERFDTVLLSGPDAKAVQVQLKPVPPWEEIDRIVITLGPGQRIRVVEIYNLLGTVTRFTLGDLREIKRFETGFFQFTVPDGVRVVEEGAM